MPDQLSLRVQNSWRNRLLLTVAPVFTILALPLVLVLYAIFWGYDCVRRFLTRPATVVRV